MQFVKVRHADGREADITAGEVASYQAMGFKPVKGEVAEPDAAAATTAAASSATHAPTSGTDQRLDAILDELRALRAAFSGASPQEPADGDTIQLREPAETTTPKPTTNQPATPTDPGAKPADAKAIDAKPADKK